MILNLLRRGEREETYCVLYMSTYTRIFTVFIYVFVYSVRCWTQTTALCHWTISFLRNQMSIKCEYKRSSLSLIYLLNQWTLYPWAVFDRKPLHQRASPWQLEVPPSLSQIPATQEIQEETDFLSNLYSRLCSGLGWIPFHLTCINCSMSGLLKLY